MRTMRILQCVVTLLVGIAMEGSSQTTPWVTVYYAGWTKWSPNPVDIPQIDFSTGTHWILFTLVPTSSGSFDGTNSGIDGTRHAQFVAGAHAAGRKAIIGTGGWGFDYTGVVTNRTTSISVLVNLMTTYGYDGVDVDWEPVPTDQYANFTAWVRDLKTAMVNVKSNALLTVAAMGLDPAVVNNRQYFDQINLMTYDMSGPWPGWVSWHNSAIYNGGSTFPSTGGPLPSIDGSINQYLAAGVPAAKLGFGIEFYGYIWEGVSGPRQSGFGNVQSGVPYFDIMNRYGGQKLQWDAAAQAAYYSTSSQFVSFDAETTMACKAKYLQSKGLGGVIIYEFAGGYQSTAPTGMKDHLIRTVKQAFLGGTPPPPPPVPSTPLFVSPQAGATGQPTTLSLRWRRSTGATKYHVQLAPDSLFVSKLVNDSTLADTLRQVTGLLEGTRYYRRVRAGNASGWSAFSVTAHFSTASAQALAAPTLLSPLNGAAQQPLLVPLAWSASSGSTAYDLEVARDAGFTTPVVVHSNLGSTSIAVGPLNRKTQYYWRVRARNSQMASAFSPAWSFRTVVSIPKTPRTLSLASAVPPPADAYTLSWSNDADAEQYRVQIAEDLLFTRVFIDTTCTDTSLTGLQFLPQSSYYARVRSENVAGVSEYTTPLLLFPVSAVGGPAAPRVTDFALHQNYPNPFNPSTTIEFDVPVQSEVSVRIYSSLGTEVASLLAGSVSAGRHAVVWNAAGIPSGTYFCRFKAGSHVVVRRLLLLK